MESGGEGKGESYIYLYSSLVPFAGTKHTPEYTALYAEVVDSMTMYIILMDHQLQNVFQVCIRHPRWYGGDINQPKYIVIGNESAVRKQRVAFIAHI